MHEHTDKPTYKPDLQGQSIYIIIVYHALYVKMDGLGCIK